MPLKIERYSGKGLSLFRAKYVAENYAAIHSAEEAVEALSAARAAGRNVACVGGASGNDRISGGRQIQGIGVSANDKTLAENARIGARLLLLFGERTMPDRGRSCDERGLWPQRGIVGIRLYRKC